MRKSIMKMGTMALIGTMLLTPASNVFAADEVQEVAVFDDGSETTETDNAVNTEDNFANADFENGNTGIETQGIITTDYIVTASSLNVRSGRGKGYPIIGSLSKGQTVKVYNNSLDDNWVKIKFNGSTGYVSARFNQKEIIHLKTIFITEISYQNLFL